MLTNCEGQINRISTEYEHVEPNKAEQPGMHELPCRIHSLNHVAALPPGLSLWGVTPAQTAIEGGAGHPLLTHSGTCGSHLSGYNTGLWMREKLYDYSETWRVRVAVGIPDI